MSIDEKRQIERTLDELEHRIDAVEARLDRLEREKRLRELGEEARHRDGG